MERQPRVDTDAWGDTLAHRPPELRSAVRDRFVENGITADQVRAVLCDGGDDLFAAASGGGEGWADRFGGPLAVALLAAEVSALGAHLNARGSAVRALAVADVATMPLRFRGQAGRRVLYPLPGVVAVLGSLALAWGVLFGTAGPASPATVAWGAALMLAARAAVGGWKLVQDRRGTGGPVS